MTIFPVSKPISRLSGNRLWYSMQGILNVFWPLWPSS